MKAVSRLSAMCLSLVSLCSFAVHGGTQLTALLWSQPTCNQTGKAHMFVVSCVHGNQRAVPADLNEAKPAGKRLEEVQSHVL